MKKIKVLYEDSNILAADKPSGILTCPDQRTNDKSVFDIFLREYPKLELVHRLDKDTSGVLLFAKNKKAHEFLKKQFQDRTIKKTYVAIVNGWMKDDRGVINKPIGRSPSDFRRWLCGRGARGELREAITEYKVLKRFTSPPSPLLEKERGEKFTYLEVKPKTGRTHQIRVHMKFLNHPVVCDSLYNPSGTCPKGLARGRSTAERISRMALHAKSIEFKTLKGETIKIESPIPKEFEKMLK